MARKRTELVESPSQDDLAARQEAMVSAAMSVVGFLTSSSPVGMIVTNQLKRIIQLKTEHGAATFSEFIANSHSPIVRWIASSPTIDMAVGVIDKGLSSGLLNDQMLGELVEKPALLGDVAKELSRLLK